MNIIVTGASRGIGYATVKHFAAHGKHKIVAISRNGDALEKLQQECENLNPDVDVIPFPFDITDKDFKSYLKPLLQDNLGSVDILINNAGKLVNKPFVELEEADYDAMFDVNVKSVVMLIQAAYELMKPGSHVVNISSMGGVQGSAKFTGLSLYSASKGAVAVLTEALAEEFKAQKISVNCLAFGAVQTEMLQEAFPGFKAPVSPQMMAGYVAEFAENGHHYFNGKVLPVSLSTP